MLHKFANYTIPLVELFLADTETATSRQVFHTNGFICCSRRIRLLSFSGKRRHRCCRDGVAVPLSQQEDALSQNVYFLQRCWPIPVALRQ